MKFQAWFSINIGRSWVEARKCHLKFWDFEYFAALNSAKQSKISLQIRDDFKIESQHLGSIAPNWLQLSDSTIQIRKLMCWGASPPWVRPMLLLLQAAGSSQPCLLPMLLPLLLNFAVLAFSISFIDEAHFALSNHLYCHVPCTTCPLISDARTRRHKSLRFFT